MPIYGPSGPAQHPGGGCWTCTHWQGEVAPDGTTPFCRNPQFNHSVGQPDKGCAYWEREPGADDEVVYARDRIARGWLVPIYSQMVEPRRRARRR